MSTIRSEHAAYVELHATARPVYKPQIGEHFAKPAPQRVTVRQPSRFVARLYAILVAFNLG